MKLWAEIDCCSGIERLVAAPARIDSYRLLCRPLACIGESLTSLALTQRVLQLVDMQPDIYCLFWVAFLLSLVFAGTLMVLCCGFLVAYVLF